MSNLDNFQDVFLRRNLGSGEPWGRQIEQRIVGAERSIERLAQRMGNEGRVSGARAELQADQIVRLGEQQEILEEQQLLLGEQQGILSAQQSVLESQQQALQNLVNAIPVTETSSGRSTGFPIPSGNRNQITLTFPVPEGKTRASVFAIGEAYFFSSGVSNAGKAGWRAVIQGNPGDAGVIIPLNMDGNSVTFSHSREFSVASLSSITILARTSAEETHPTVSENRANLNATVTFS